MEGHSLVECAPRCSCMIQYKSVVSLCDEASRRDQVPGVQSPLGLFRPPPLQVLLIPPVGLLDVLYVQMGLGLDPCSDDGRRSRGLSGRWSQWRASGFL